MIETIWEIMVNLLESTIFILFFTRKFQSVDIHILSTLWNFRCYYYRNGYHVFL